MTFETYMEQVDRWLSLKAGLEHLDLDDYDYTTAFQDGVAPSKAARNALKAAKDACGL